MLKMNNSIKIRRLKEINDIREEISFNRMDDFPMCSFLTLIRFISESIIQL